MLCYFVTCFWAGSNCISSDFYDLSSTVNEVRSPKSVSTSVEGSTLHTNIKYLFWSLLNNKINNITTSSGLLLSLLHQGKQCLFDFHFSPLIFCQESLNIWRLLVQISPITVNIRPFRRFLYICINIHLPICAQ